jgi:hypothetical protein
MLHQQRMMPPRDRRRRPPCRLNEADLIQVSKPSLQWRAPFLHSSCRTPPCPASPKKLQSSSTHNSSLSQCLPSIKPSSRTHNSRFRWRPSSNSMFRSLPATDLSSPGSQHLQASCHGPGCLPPSTLGRHGRPRPSSHHDPLHRSRHSRNWLYRRTRAPSSPLWSYSRPSRTRARGEEEVMIRLAMIRKPIRNRSSHSKTSTSPVQASSALLISRLSGIYYPTYATCQTRSLPLPPCRHSSR